MIFCLSTIQQINHFLNIHHLQAKMIGVTVAIIPGFLIIQNI